MNGVRKMVTLTKCSKYKILQALQLQDFHNDQQIAAEYSVFHSCLKSDSGYHCSHYNENKPCHLCEKEMSEEENEICRTA
jgi:hypothetical protein